MLYKVCTRCGDLLPADSFSTDRYQGDGLKSACRVCDRARAAAYYRDHKEAVLRRQRLYQARRRQEVTS